MSVLRLALLLALWSCGTAPALAQKAPYVPLRQWLEPARIVSMKLSPDGKRVAGIGRAPGWLVFVLDVDRMETRVISKRRPVAVNWISDDLLAVDDDTDSWSMDLTGKYVKRLGQRFVRRMTEKGQAGDLVLAYRDVDDRDIDVVDARTGERTRYRVGLPGKLLHWAFDASGALRAATTMDTSYWTETSKISNWYRPAETAPWQLLEEVPITADPFFPMRVLAQPDTLAVWSRHGRDTYAVYRYDAAKRQHLDVMAGHPHEDIAGVEGVDDSTFENVWTSGIKPRISWFDARWAGLQQAVDAALPGRINVLQGNKNARVLVWSYGDVDPGHWYVLDTSTSRLREVGAARPTLDATWMRPMETLPYRARDGMDIHAYLTRPGREAGGPAPMVVMIHGGPHVRDRWAWEPQVQFLASQGYAVFQPQFRGSAGFGRRYQEAGYRQWGRAMQDDITDGVRAMIERGVADPARICIVGASYGGYAALWGVIKTPDLYRCGVSFAGVSDLASAMSNSIFNDSTAVSRELWRRSIGDPQKERADLEETSPLKHAAQVRVPLLIAHGEQDRRVLSAQSKNMVEALRALGKPVEWMSFPYEGHGLYWPDNQADWYAALLSFLQRHIGDRDPPRDQGMPAAAAPPDAGLDTVREAGTIPTMNEVPKPGNAPEPPPDPRLQALIQLRDELQALNARLEYAALLLRLARPTLPH